MAFSNQKVTSTADWVSKLNTFLIADGWVTHHVPASGEFAARKTPGGQDIAFALQWDTVTPDIVGVYQHLGAYNNALKPYNQANDSGNGAASASRATLIGQRHVASTSPDEVWFFSGPNHIYVVIGQPAATDVQHFGAGSGVKYGDGNWTGGEFVFGQRFHKGPSSLVAVLEGSTALLDGWCRSNLNGAPANMQEYAATVHMEGFPNMVASQKWQVVMGEQSLLSLGNDSAAIARGLCCGGFRAGMGVLQWGGFRSNPAVGMVPGYPINTSYLDPTTGDVHGPMLRMPDVRGININDYVIGDAITIGSDTWRAFPTGRKFVSGSQVNTSGLQGIMYREIP